MRRAHSAPLVHLVNIVAIRERPPDKLWEPSAERIERSQMTQYVRWLGAQRGVQIDGYDELWRWSVENIEEFWASIWDYFEVESAIPYERVLSSHEMPGARWFEGAEINYAEHVFRGKDPSAIAVRHASELRGLAELSWGELSAQVAQIAAGLRSLGVERGDRVVAYMPNIPETLAAFLATASIGAVWSSCSPDFGPASVVDRFAQIEPKILLCVDGYRYNGRDFDRTEPCRRAAGRDALAPQDDRAALPDGRSGPERRSPKRFFGRS